MILASLELGVSRMASEHTPLLRINEITDADWLDQLIFNAVPRALIMSFVTPPYFARVEHGS